MKNKKDKPARPYSAAPREKAGGKPPFKGARRQDAAKPGKAEVQAEGSADGERIAKRLARAGVASRRDAEAIIEAGRVKVNGRVLSSPAFNVRASDRIEVDDEPLPEPERTRLFLFHKPAGVVTTTRDPEGRKTIFDILPGGLPRLITVGRLDINTEGLLLLTNDGGLARVLELPATGWLRRYRVRVHGKVDPTALAELEHGIAVDGVFYGAITATLDRQQGSNAWLTLGLREGKNREVKNVLGSLGLDVTRLIRISYGPFQLGDLPEGAVQEIKGRMLRDQLGDRLIEQAGANFDAPIAKPFTNKPVRGERPRPAGEEPPRSTERERSERPEKRLINRKREREERREEARDRLQTQRPARFEGKSKSTRQGKDDRPPRSRSGEREEPRSKREDAPKPFRAAKDARPAHFEGQSGPSRHGRDDRPQRPRSGEKDEPRAKREYAPRAGGDARPGRDARPERPSKSGRPGRDAKQERSPREPLERRSRTSNVWMAPGARPVGKKRAEEVTVEAGKKPRAARDDGRAKRRPEGEQGRSKNDAKPAPGKKPKGR